MNLTLSSSAFDFRELNTLRFSIAPTRIIQSIQLRLLEYILNKCVGKSIKEATQLNLKLEGIYKKILEREGAIKDPIAAHQILVGFVDSFTKINDTYKKVNFFESLELEILIGNTLDLAYDIEAELKVQALSKKPIEKTEYSIKKGLSESSMRVISPKLS